MDFMGKNLHPYYESHLELLANKVNKSEEIHVYDTRCFKITYYCYVSNSSQRIV